MNILNPILHPSKNYAITICIKNLFEMNYSKLPDLELQIHNELNRIMTTFHLKNWILSARKFKKIASKKKRLLGL